MELDENLKIKGKECGGILGARFMYSTERDRSLLAVVNTEYGW